eukprot:gene11621-biopygen6917
MWRAGIGFWEESLAPTRESYILYTCGGSDDELATNGSTPSVLGFRVTRPRGGGFAGGMLCVHKHLPTRQTGSPWAARVGHRGRQEPRLAFQLA